MNYCQLPAKCSTTVQARPGPGYKVHASMACVSCVRSSVGLTGDKVDEMMAETPEHLSGLGDEDQQKKSAQKGPQDTSRPSSPQQAADSDAEHANSSGRKSRRERKDNRDGHRAEDNGPSGEVQSEFACSFTPLQPPVLSTSYIVCFHTR